MTSNPKVRRSGASPQSRQVIEPVSGHAKKIEAELDRLGLLPTAEDRVIYRGLGKNGFGLFLYLENGLDLQTIGRLADHTDLTGALILTVASGA